MKQNKHEGTAITKAEHILENRKVKCDAEKKESLAKCLAMTMLLSKEEYEALSPDAFKKLFGDWKQRELKCLYRFYETNELILE